MRCLDAIQEEHLQIMASIVGVRQHIGMDHPLFPQAGPVVPPPTQPMHAGHDGDGPSNIRHGDTDDNNRKRRASMRAVTSMWESLRVWFVF